MGYEDWFVDSDIIAPGSAEQGFERRRYFQSMRWRKELFAAVVQTKVESHTKNIDTLLLSKLIELRKSLSPALVEKIRKEFEKWRAICAYVGGVLAWVACLRG